MSSSFGISLSGLDAASARFAAAANNIANANSAGIATDIAGSSGTDPPTVTGRYEPVRVHQTTVAGGGVGTVEVPIEPATRGVFSPDDPRAGEDGTVAYPNVSVASEFVETRQATLAYKANLAMLEVGDEMLGELLDTVS